MTTAVKEHEINYIWTTPVWCRHMVHDFSLQLTPRCIWPMLPPPHSLNSIRRPRDQRSNKAQKQSTASHFYYNGKTTEFVWPHCPCQPIPGPLTCSLGSHQLSPAEWHCQLGGLGFASELDARRCNIGFHSVRQCVWQKSRPHSLKGMPPDDDSDDCFYHQLWPTMSQSRNSLMSHSTHNRPLSEKSLSRQSTAPVMTSSSFLACNFKIA